jgi:hypothetical protein
MSEDNRVVNVINILLAAGTTLAARNKCLVWTLSRTVENLNIGVAKIVKVILAAGTDQHGRDKALVNAINTAYFREETADIVMDILAAGMSLAARNTALVEAAARMRTRDNARAIWPNARASRTSWRRSGISRRRCDDDREREKEAHHCKACIFLIP